MREYIGKCFDIYAKNTLVDSGVCLYVDELILVIKSVTSK